jgi:hypothetical protein
MEAAAVGRAKMAAVAFPPPGPPSQLGSHPMETVAQHGTAAETKIFTAAWLHRTTKYPCGAPQLRP